MLRIFLLLASFAIFSINCQLVQPDTACLDAFRTAALQKHNDLRKLHNVPALVINNTINTFSQNYSMYLAKQKSGLVHNVEAKTKKYGENLYVLMYSSPVTVTTALCQKMGSDSAQSWYDEIKDYNFAAPNPLDKTKVTGHFTQLVWKSTSQIGLGLGVNGGFLYVVANYFQAGNMINGTPGQDTALFYKQNVLPKA